jgi:hypothetical protein
MGVLASEFGREKVTARVSRGGLYNFNLPLLSSLIFIEHTHRWSISTLNLLVSNNYKH